VQSQIEDFVLTFTSILWEAFPFVVLGALIAGILEEVVPQQLIAKLVPKNNVLAVGMGCLLGLVFPMCECGIVPVMRRLLRKGLPLGTCVAYMLAGPIINFVVITSTAVAFYPHKYGVDQQSVGPWMVGLRVGMGFVVALITGLIIDRMYQRHGTSLLTPMAAPKPGAANLMATPDVHPAENRAGESRSIFQRLGNISETALHDFVDIMVFLSLGAALSALVKASLSSEQVRDLGTAFPPAMILAMMGMAIILCLCSEADAFVAASFTTLPISGKISFLVLGPMFDLKLLLMFTRVFRRKVIVTIICSVVIQVFIYSMILHYVWTGVIDPPVVSPDAATVSNPG
jgi:uncharacterized membrane protein YraQ (UPF0718 family)